jgi:hypothetical protein
MSKWGLEFASSARAMAAPSRPTECPRHPLSRLHEERSGSYDVTRGIYGRRGCCADGDAARSGLG